MDIKMNNGSATLSVADDIFNVSFNEPLIHQVVTAYLAGGRAGTKAQKTRSEVSGGGAKPWKQKGTGRARAGTIRSPIWRTGGVTFAAKPRSYAQKVNKKMYRAAMCSILSELVRLDRLVIIDTFELSSHKTKDFISYAQEHNIGSDVLIVSESANMNAFMATRNVPCVSLIDVQALNPVTLLRHGSVVIDKAAIEKISEWLS